MASENTPDDPAEEQAYHECYHLSPAISIPHGEERVLNIISQGFSETF